MSQRDSGYERKERDCYETPEWVTAAVIPHLPPTGSMVWEPAAGSGKMANALRSRGYAVLSSDISDPEPFDFLKFNGETKCVGIITNPPYHFAKEFIEHAIKLMAQCDGWVAMLLRTDFDHAKTRQCLFGECEHFAKKIVLTKRIRWFEETKGQPSFNHAWFLWNWQHWGPPTLAYGPQ